MLRLTLILCLGLFAALMIAGEDRGQLRPGLADAAARRALSQAEPVADSPAAESLTVVTADPVTPAAKPVAKSAPAAVTRAKPEAYVEPERKLVTQVEEPVFSLASVGNGPAPGTEAAPRTATPEVASGGVGTIWYVVANSVNVRAEPSTEAEVLGRLASGEATLLVQAVDEDWARIVIQGDGVEGFVAMRYLSPVSP